MLGKNIYALFYFKVIFHVLSIFLMTFVECESHLFNFLVNKDTSTLTPRFWLANKKYYRVNLGLCLSHFTIFNFLFASFSFLFRVFLYVMEFCWVHPGLWKELVVFWKLFLEPFQMHAQGALSTNIIHSQKMVAPLTICQRGKKVRSHSRVSPEYIPIIRMMVVNYLKLLLDFIFGLRLTSTILV